MAGFSQEALLQLFEQHRNELRLHCYRMLGSSHDTDDVLQETALRAWRAVSTLEEPASTRAWLYRIATNVCFDELARRRTRHLPQELGPAAPHGKPTILDPEPEALVEPCPAAWFEHVAADPAARYETHECVALAFVAALQFLTPVQRATLLLRDVVGLSADETSRSLGLGLEATNSALFRARSAVDAKIPTPDTVKASTPGTEELLHRYLTAWNQLDLSAFVALLHDEVRTTMPPSPTWVAGRAHNVEFYQPMFAAQRQGMFVAVPTAANAHAAFAFYRALAVGEPRRLRAIQLVELKEQRVVGIDHFMLPELAPTFGLPSELDEGVTASALLARPCIDVAAEALRENRHR